MAEQKSAFSEAYADWDGAFRATGEAQDQAYDDFRAGWNAAVEAAAKVAHTYMEAAAENEIGYTSSESDTEERRLFIACAAAGKNMARFISADLRALKEPTP